MDYSLQMVCVSQAFHKGWYRTAIFCLSVPLDRTSSSKPHAESLDFCLGRSLSLFLVRLLCVWVYLQAMFVHEL